MPGIFDILDNDFWNQSFYFEENTNQALQKLSSLDDQHIQDLKAAYQENPFLFLRFNNKMLDELKKLGIDIVVDHNDQNRIFAITEDGLMKQYDEIFRSSKSYFDSVTGDGYCQTYATVQAFGLGKITQTEAKKIRQEIAEASVCRYLKQISKSIGYEIKNFDDIPKELIDDANCEPYFWEYKELMGLGPGAPWARSSSVVSYFSKKYKKPAYDIGISYSDQDLKDIAGIIFNVFDSGSIQDILYGCPVVCLNGVAHNHSINLKADRAERKKFALEFHNLFRDAIIATLFWEYNLCYNGADLPQMSFGVNSNFKNNFYEFTLPGLLNGLFKEIDIQEVITQLKNFFNGVPHKYKNMIAIKLIFYIFDEYKTKILEPFDINMPEDKFITANEFLSGVIVDFKKEVFDKIPELEQTSDKENEDKYDEKPDQKSDNVQQSIPENPEQKLIDEKKVEEQPNTPDTSPVSNNQNVSKPEENVKKDEIKDNEKDKPKPKSSKKIFSGPKWLYIFLCIITLSIFYFFRSSPQTKKYGPILTKGNENKDKNDNSEVKINADEDKKYLLSKSNPETKPLSGLNSLKNNRADEKIKNAKSQFCQSQDRH